MRLHLANIAYRSGNKQLLFSPDYETIMNNEQAIALARGSYRAEIVAEEGNMKVPEIAGMLVKGSGEGFELKPMKGITTAQDIFSEIYIRVVRPKPRIIGN